jgi:hypothetical protein
MEAVDSTENVEIKKPAERTSLTDLPYPTLIERFGKFRAFFPKLFGHTALFQLNELGKMFRTLKYRISRIRLSRDV